MRTKIVRTYAIAIVGLTGNLIDVETHIAPGLVAFNLVGLPDTGVKESKDRVRAALQTCGFKWIEHRVTVNLSPANVPKMGSGFDLAIAIGLLGAQGYLKETKLRETIFLAELGLDGTLQPIRGILPAVLTARQYGFRTVVVPCAQAKEASLVPGIEIIGLANLAEVITQFGGKVEANTGNFRPREKLVENYCETTQPDLAEVKGQNFAVQALVTAAAGGHHLLLVGEPGAGKTMLAQRLPGILPKLTGEAALEVTAIQSVAGRKQVANGLIEIPPIEAPHHSASMVAMVGGGTGLPSPGAISLAHQGVLFLDEATEFTPKVLDALRQPLETGNITISRAKAQVTFPARFQLILATNPCPCGYAISRTKTCSCTPTQKRKYLGRLSGPLLDRIDMQIPLITPTVTALEIPPLFTTETALEAVEMAREKARQRWYRNYGIKTNSQITTQLIRSEAMGISELVNQQIQKALSRATLSLRGIDRVLKVARTIADLRDSETIEINDFGQAMQYRNGLKNV
ncbi:YifB family Mg chelatase-like AAA ATPase [Gleimia sp. 6138-11-ORH1]|uniref:YifB family Mg chelatase-like AAA ATPase n=1 Tax=Gleimia sp. 6138-11-ORH1 TaxID=2973937 RepID=UPI00216A44C2|nr:YifB family Mg chelatase-like AAA ATPase [Gleimia sp. 6138-11-ORH1]MCS4484893.1 YifB family Mg chelatase-like AAA ATPase [Gleimia sp. 6138-11-ORH1]